MSELMRENLVLNSGNLQKKNGMKNKKPVIGWSWRRNNEIKKTGVSPSIWSILAKVEETNQFITGRATLLHWFHFGSKGMGGIPPSRGNRFGKSEAAPGEAEEHVLPPDRPVHRLGLRAGVGRAVAFGIIYRLGSLGV
jgi:hypothetical protein